MHNVQNCKSETRNSSYKKLYNLTLKYEFCKIGTTLFTNHNDFSKTKETT